MKQLALVIAAALLTACAAPPPAAPWDGPASASFKELATGVRAKISYLREQREHATLQEEIARLEREIEELEARLIALEQEDAAAEQARAAIAASVPTGAGVGQSSRGSLGTGPVYTGPRGGRYTITPSGKKSYIRRK